MSDSLEMFPGAGRRLKVLVMTGPALFGFLRGLDGRAAYRMYGMPEDAKCVGVTTSRDGDGAVAFLLESAEWPEVSLNSAEIPEVKFEILTALMPNRLEKPAAMVNKTQPAPQAETRFRKLE